MATVKGKASGVGGGAEGSIVVHAAGRRLGAVTLLRPALAAADGEADPEVSAGTSTPRLSGGTGAEDLDLGASAADADAADGRVGPRLAAAVDAPVGSRAALRVALAPGRHRYTIAVRGPDAVVQARAGRSNQRLAAALRGDAVAGLLRRAGRALDDTDSHPVPLGRALIAGLAGAPAPDPGAGGSPTLALVVTLLAAQAEALDAARG